MKKTLSNKQSTEGNLLIVGSVAFDTIETPSGKADNALGGSASYFSLAASFFGRPSLVAVVGRDFTDVHRAILNKHRVDLSGLEQAEGKSFRWGGKYSFDLNNRQTLFTYLNVFEKFEPKLSAHHKNISHLFLGNIHPSLQLKVLSQMQKPKLVGLDTMNYWIEKTPRELAAILKMVNLLVINDSEARELSGEHNLLKAAKKIMGMMGVAKKPILIIKRGEYGLLMFSYGYGHKLLLFHLPGYPLEDVVDPTGAGDSFAGGLIGYLAKTGDHSWENFKRACVAGSVMASFCVEKLGTQRLQEISSRDMNQRFKKFKVLTHFEFR